MTRGDGPVPVGSPFALAFALSALLPTGVSAQQQVPTCRPIVPPAAALAGVFAEYDRMRQLSSGEAEPRFLVRPSDGPVLRACAGRGGLLGRSAGPMELLVLPVFAGAQLRSGYPDDRNNGLLWSGRGAGAAVSAGLALRWGVFSAGLVPEAAYASNASYRTVPRDAPGFSPYIHPFTTAIDLPQRFGEESYTEVGWGQSFVRLDGFGLAAGASTENVWLGPAARNPLLMGNSAPGFPHVFMETTRPVDLWIARVSGHVLLGRLEESDHFDEVPENDRSALALWTFGLQPRWLEGLELGIARALSYRPESQSRFVTLDDLDALTPSQQENLAGNELASLFFRWIFSEASAEIYGEWGRDDRWAGVTTDLIPEPDHSQAYTIGFQKLTDVADERHVRVQLELTALQEKQEPRAGRPLPIWYTHSEVRQGYTHRGQMLGAGIGPGADAQFLGVDLLADWGFAGLFLERVRRNDASGVAIQERFTFPLAHDTELTGGVRGILLLRDFAISGALAWSQRWDRDFLEDDSNLALDVTGTWWPGGLATHQ